MRVSFTFVSLAMLALAACADPYPPTPKPDYAIRIAPSAKGLVAVPPECPSYATATIDPYDNQPLPQFGCANARNLAMMVEKPEDLLKGREMGDTRGVIAVGAMRRYDNNQTRGLIDTTSSPNSAVATTTASTPSSGMTGDAAGGSGAASAAPAAAP